MAKRGVPRKGRGDVEALQDYTDADAKTFSRGAKLWLRNHAKQCVCFASLAGCILVYWYHQMPVGHFPQVYSHPDRPWWVDELGHDMPLDRSRKLLHRIEESERGKSRHVLIHTEINPQAKPFLCKKNRLPSLSILATQPNVSLVVWFYEPWWIPELVNCFQDLRESETCGPRIQLRMFDPKKELASLRGFFSSEEIHVFGNTSLGQGAKGELPNFSNLRRYTILYNYGGIWADTDAMFLRPFSIISNLSWVYACPERFRYLEELPFWYKSIHMNGGIMGVRSAHSEWMLSCIHEVLKEISAPKTFRQSYYKWGGNLFWNIRKRALAEGWDSPFLWLPCLWFDSGWTLGSYPGTKFNWVRTFDGNASDADVAAVLGETGILAFHFHGGGNWSADVHDGSLASKLMRHWEKQLRLS